jgi:hypothetical protein
MPNIKDQYTAALHAYPDINAPKPIDTNRLQEPAPTQAQLRARLRAALNVAVDPLALAEITQRLVAEAKLGSQWAMKLLFEQLRGSTDAEAAENVEKPLLSAAETERMLKELGFERKR